jgi:hypothetical protein
MTKDCQRPKIICFGCNQVGHMKNQCSNRAAWGKKATGGGFDRGGNSGGYGACKKNRPFGKLNCTSLEEVHDSDKAVIGTLQLLSHPGKYFLILVQLLCSFLKSLLIFIEFLAIS